MNRTLPQRQAVNKRNLLTIDINYEQEILCLVYAIHLIDGDCSPGCTISEVLPPNVVQKKAHALWTMRNASTDNEGPDDKTYFDKDSKETRKSLES